MKKPVIAIYAGHHAGAQGASDKHGRTEHAIVSEHFVPPLVRALETVLPGGHIIGWGGHSYGLTAKAKISKDMAVDFAFDLHLDASPDPKTSRMGVWYHDTATSVTEGVAFYMVKYLDTVGIKNAAKPMQLSDERDGFAETHEKHGIPALVVEIEFITNQSALDMAIARAGELMTQLALAIHHGLRGKGLVP